MNYHARSILAEDARSEAAIPRVNTPDGTLFLMVQPVYVCADGREQITYHAFLADGIMSRTAQRRGALSPWRWLCRWEDGEPCPWRGPMLYDGETPEQMRAWHEREHGWVML